MARVKSCLLAFVTTSSLLAGSACAFAEESSALELAPSTHAPAGVMSEHMHEAGEFMIGYRYMYDYSGSTMLSGSNTASDMQIAHAGFSSTPERMTMHMHMLDIMYAPTDWLTLMLMPQYMSMNMTMRPVAGAMDHGGITVGSMADTRWARTRMGPRELATQHSRRLFVCSRVAKTMSMSLWS